MKQISRQTVYQNRNLLILTVIVALGVYLRFKGLTFQSYRPDELSAAASSDPSLSFFDMLKTIPNQHPPFYYILLWVWYMLMGYTEFAGRSLTAVFGTLGIIACYFLGRAAQDQRTGLYAALIASCNYFAIYYSQDIKSYPLQFLLAALSFLFLLRTLENPRPRTGLLYAIATIALLYTHFAAIFLVASQAGFYGYRLIAQRENRRSLFRVGILISLCMILLSVPLLEHLLEMAARETFWPSLDTEILFIWECFKAYFLSEPLTYLFVFTLLLALGYAVFSKNQQQNLAVSMLMSCVLGFFLLMYVKSRIGPPIQIPRYTIVTLPAFFTMFAIGIAAIRKPWAEFTVCATVLVLSVALLFVDIHYYSKTTKPQFRELVQAMLSEPEHYPIYVYNFRRTIKLNVYLKQFGSNVRAGTEMQLEKALRHRTVEDAFWDVNDKTSKGNEDLSKLKRQMGFAREKVVKKHRVSATLYRRNGAR